MTTSELRPADKLAGDLGEWLCERVWNQLGTLRFRSGEYRLAEPADGDDEFAVLLEGPDGTVYDVEIEVMATARRPKPPQAPEVQPGQMTIDQAATS